MTFSPKNWKHNFFPKTKPSFLHFLAISRYHSIVTKYLLSDFYVSLSRRLCSIIDRRRYPEVLSVFKIEYQNNFFYEDKSNPLFFLKCQLLSWMRSLVSICWFQRLDSIPQENFEIAKCKTMHFVHILPNNQILKNHPLESSLPISLK